MPIVLTNRDYEYLHLWGNRGVYSLNEHYQLRRDRIIGNIGMNTIGYNVVGQCWFNEPGETGSTATTGNNYKQMYRWQNITSNGYTAICCRGNPSNPSTSWASGSNTVTLAVATDGTLWVAGSSSDMVNTLATGERYWSTPTKIHNDTDWVDVQSCGSFATSVLALKSNGQLCGWGNGGFGILGQGNTSSQNTTPVQISGSWSKICVTAQASALALKTDGTLWSWGNNAIAATGLNTTSGSTNSPTQIGSDTWIDIAMAQSVAAGAGIKSDGTLWTWGGNGSGQTGLGTTSGTTLVPTKVGTATDWAEVAAGSNFMVGRRTNGNIYAWGNNYIYDGTGITTTTSSPTKVGTRQYTKIWVAGRILFALDSNNDVYIGAEIAFFPWQFRLKNASGTPSMTKAFTLPAGYSLAVSDVIGNMTTSQYSHAAYSIYPTP